MDSIAIVGARLLDGLGDGPVDGVTIVVEDARLAAVGTDVQVPPSADVIDVAGATVTPGLVDAHVHLAFAGSPASVAKGGVTAVRDLGWPPDRFAAVRRSARAAGLLVRWVGPILTAPGGYPARAGWAPPGTAQPVSTVTEARAAVDATVAAGACAVKVAMEPRAGPTLSDEVLLAIVQRAAEHGRHVTAHVATVAALASCIEAGVAELAHMPLGPEPIPDDLVAAAVAAEVVAVPTLHCREADRDGGSSGLTALRQWVAAHGRVVYGTDLGNARTRPGADARELSLLTRAGMTPGAALVACTSAAARQIGAGNETGTVAAGLRADLLVLAEDPLLDVTALARPSLIVLNGRVVRRSRLGSALHAIVGRTTTRLPRR